MGRRIAASLFLLLAIGLWSHPLVLSQAPPGSQPTAGINAPLHLYRPGLVDPGAATTPVQVVAQDWWATLLHEDFEGGFPGSVWTLRGNPTWGTTSFRSHSGGFSAYCAAGGSSAVSAPGPYPNDMEAWMIYGPFDLSQASDAEVQFAFYSNTEAEVDYLALVAASDGANWHGTTWSSDYTGDCSGWCQYTFRLTQVEGLGNLCGRPSVKIAFLFRSDSDAQNEGSYLDDITLRALHSGAPTATPTPTGALTPTATATATPTATPTPTPAGTYNDPLPALCDAIYSGNTASYPAIVSGYGVCGSGMSGPEVVYALDSGQPLASLGVDFAGGTQRRLFLLTGDGSATCLGSASMSQALVVRELPAGRYFLVVDGSAPGSYFFSIHCSAMPTPTSTPPRRQLYLPLTIRTGNLALAPDSSTIKPAGSWLLRTMDWRINQ